MTKLDTTLLFYRSENPRCKLKELSSLMEKSPQRLKYTLKQWEKERLTYSPFSIIDYSFFGLHLFRVYFKGAYVSEKDKLVLLAMLKEHPYIVSFYELSGEFDLVVEMEAPNASRFNKELKKLISLSPALSNYKIVVNIVSHLYPRWYLLGAVSGSVSTGGAVTGSVSTAISPLLSAMEGIGRDVIVGGDRQLEIFKAEELALLQALHRHPLLRSSSLAKHTSLNIKTVMSLSKKLHKRRIVKGFRYVIDTNRLGIYKHRLFLKLHNLTAERETALMEFFTRQPNIVQLNKTVGDWDLELDLEALDKSVLRSCTAELREKFRDLIQTFNSMEFYQYYLKSFLPQALFEEGKGK